MTMTNFFGQQRLPESSIKKALFSGQTTIVKISWKPMQRPSTVHQRFVSFWNRGLKPPRPRGEFDWIKSMLTISFHDNASLQPWGKLDGLFISEKALRELGNPPTLIFRRQEEVGTQIRKLEAKNWKRVKRLCRNLGRAFN